MSKELNDIVREMRAKTAKTKEEAWYDQARWAELCDRIEAAAKHGAGNAAAMREALEFAVRQLINAIEDDSLGGNILYLAGCMRTVANKCKAALAAPARNCDRFNNADELIAYYGDEGMKEGWKELKEKIKNGEYEFAIDFVLMIDWLFAKAKGEKK
jgi:hypothetical protein